MKRLGDDGTVTLKRCERSLPLFAKLNPAPKVRSIALGAGIHSCGWTDEEFPMGIVSPVAKLWHDASLVRVVRSLVLHWQP